jgi:hypothetical protein
MHTLIEDKLEVFVAFGRMAPKTESDKKIHVTYETCVSSLVTKATLVSTVCAFDGYRQLYKDLITGGCSAKSIDPFPPTYAQSSWGIALSKEQLAERLVGLCGMCVHFDVCVCVRVLYVLRCVSVTQRCCVCALCVCRCFGLSKWIGLVCKAYDSMPQVAQTTFHTFLGLETDTNRTHTDIVCVLNHGTLAADSPILVAPNSTSKRGGVSSDSTDNEPASKSGKLVVCGVCLCAFFAWSV